MESPPQTSLLSNLSPSLSRYRPGAELAGGLVQFWTSPAGHLTDVPPLKPLDDAITGLPHRHIFFVRRWFSRTCKSASFSLLAPPSRQHELSLPAVYIAHMLVPSILSFESDGWGQFVSLSLVLVDSNSIQMLNRGNSCNCSYWSFNVTQVLNHPIKCVWGPDPKPTLYNWLMKKKKKTVKT